MDGVYTENIHFNPILFRTSWCCSPRKLEFDIGYEAFWFGREELLEKVLRNLTLVDMQQNVRMLDE